LLKAHMLAQVHVLSGVKHINSLNTKGFNSSIVLSSHLSSLKKTSTTL